MEFRCRSKEIQTLKELTLSKICLFDKCFFNKDNFFNQQKMYAYFTLFPINWFFFFMYPCLLIQSLNRYCTFRGHHGCHHMVVGFSYHHWSREFESRSWRGVLDITLCDKVCQWLAAGPGYLRVLRFPPPIKLTTTM